MGDKVVADQWGCDVALTGADYQGIHVDYRHPLFSELPDLQLPVYMLIVSFGLGPITITDGPIEIAPGTQNMQRTQALRAAESGEVELQAVPLEVGDVLIRHPWAIHRGSPNRSITARALVSIRYVRSWYDDKSRDVSLMPQQVWESLTSEQQNMMRFSVEGRHSPNVISF
jgi:ectoine hydroxylase-related dioxygenase (phytanoyl-CoA dioxygenase family)